MTKHYDKINNRLVFTKQSATPGYWDKLWLEGNFKKRFLEISQIKYYADITRQFLPANSSIRILEGGCGIGAIAHSLAQAGYNTYGVDYATNTINKTKELFPGLKLSVGDVANLNFPTNYFNGYWSLGVIEHNYTGYQPIIAEMQRVIKPGGILFITFPQMSVIRQLKAKLNKYPTWQENKENINQFYQFALDYKKVTKDLSKLGFQQLKQNSVDASKGIKEEILPLKPFIKKISSSHNPGLSLINRSIEIFAPLAGHIRMSIFRYSP